MQPETSRETTGSWVMHEEGGGPARQLPGCTEQLVIPSAFRFRRLHPLLLASGSVLLLLLAGCGGTTPSASPTSPVDPGGTIESHSDLDGSQLCTVANGRARLNTLFYALNHADAAMAARMFPDNEAWELTFSPSIHAALESGVASSQELHITSRADIPRLLSQLVGVHFVFAAGIDGNVVPTQQSTVHEVALGPVLWRATGSYLQNRGKNRVFEGGKAAVSCTTGLFRRVLLSPLTIS